MDSLNFNTNNMEGILHHIKRGDPNNAGVDISKLFKKGEDISIPSIQQFDEKDIKELEDFCKKMGIIGFHCGMVNPKNALRMLKSRMGIQDTPPIVENKKGLLYD